MPNYETGAATARPPSTSEPGRMDRWARRSAGVPFRLKVAAVWLVERLDAP